ncbi:MAG: type IV pilus assembly protein PilO [Candidatus Berkelbacteria bacterium Licking1014_96]|uniref:Type IV pilus assembly protein PilO n=1 Tax=Candidatus Berkelbacteria bacterium Licking1014_96 TaxID=2017149 RepID=A0A554LCW8_9BACT|nr:MAG: type IV pilus assembly protein PilO [Candidatus Berkelbacteria bacterium Licking1014_96]
MQKTNRDVIIIIVCLIVVVLLSYFAVFPKLSQIKEQNYDLGLKRDELEKTQEHLASVKEMEPQMDRKKDDLNALNEALPMGEDIQDLVALLEAAAKDKGLTISTIIPLNTEEDLAAAEVITTPEGFVISQMGVEVNLVGSYPQLKGFLEALEGTRKIINVKDLSISSAAGTLAANNLVITMSLNSYYLNNS